MSNSTFDEFRPLPSTSTFAGLARFGHTKDFTALFQEDEDRQDYVVGLIFVGCLILSLLLVWGLLLVVWKCCLRQPKVGFLSGSAYRAEVPEEQQAKEESVALADQYGVSAHQTAVDGHGGVNNVNNVNSNERSETQRQWPNRPMRGRIVFLLSGVIYIIFSALLVTKGITNLQSSVNTLNVSAQQINILSTEAADIIRNGLRDLKDSAAAVRVQISDQFQGQAFCPADPTLQSSALGQDISGQADDAILLLDRLDNFASDDLTTLQDGVTSVSSRSLDVIEYTEDIDLNDWEALLFLIPYIVVPSVLMSACFMALFEVEYHPVFQSIIHYFFMPLFIIMNVVAFIFAGLMVIGAGGVADFCLPGAQTDASPDQTLIQILELEGYGPESMVYAIFQYYIEKCSEGIEDPFLFLREYVADVMDIDGSLGQLKAAIDGEGVLEELSLYCNRQFEPLGALVNQLLEILVILREAGERTLDLASCDRIVPIYTNTIYTGTCDYSLKALIWIFSCALIIGTSGMLMVTFRAACKPTVFEDSDGTRLEGSDGADTDMNITTPRVSEVRVATDDDFSGGEQRIPKVHSSPTVDWVDDDSYSDYDYRNEKGGEMPLRLD